MLVKYRPSSFIEMFRNFDSLFDRWEVYEHQYQSVTMSEDTDNIYYKFIVPGFTSSDLKVEALNGELKVSALSESEGKSKSSFLRTTVPVNVDLTKASSKYKAGVLTVVLPKKSKEQSNFTIKVEDE